MTEKESKKRNEPREIDLFVQGEGLPEVKLVKTTENSTLRDLLKTLAATFGGVLAEAEDLKDFLVMREDDDREIAVDQEIAKAGIKNRDRLHFHRCRKVKVIVNFNGRAISESFSPSVTVSRIKKWADKEFEIDEIDATEHALQLCGGAVRPDEDTHVGKLASHKTCSVCFDLVPKKRVEGDSI